MDSPYTSFMRDLEHRFRQATGLTNRSAYKIFYCQVHPAPILTIGVNPGGPPAETNADGQTRKDGTITAASASFYENNEHDVLDCNWSENSGLRKLLTPLVQGDASRIRSEVVKTNLAFRRSPRKHDINADAAIAEAAPFLSEILEVVRPRLVLLTGVELGVFLRLFAHSPRILVQPEKDPRIHHVVFAAACATLGRSAQETLVV
jgi:hypothetical protein